MIKTLRGNEKSMLLELVDDYVKHVEDTQNQSLLARVYGVYTIKSKLLDKVDVMVMQNTAKLVRTVKNGLKMDFDLKGSLVSRKVKFNMEQLKFSKKIRK